MSANDAGGRESPEIQPAPSMVAPGSDSGKDAPPVLLASGIDYQLTTLPDLAALPMASTQTSRAAAEAPPGTMAGGHGDLNDQTSLERCLNAVLVAYPGTVAVVDYATYEGRPAVMIVVRQEHGSTVVAVGPECGETGTDELASVLVQ
jgi:hypothetical protein